MLDREHFTEAEAEGLVGQTYRTNRGYTDVPPDTLGVVVGTWKHAAGGYAVSVMWLRPEDRDALNNPSFSPALQPLVDGFSREDLLMRFEDGTRAMQPVQNHDDADEGHVTYKDEVA